MAPRACACRARLDPLGDHRAACANAGALASRALPLERAVAHVCQETGARVARNVRQADMNIDVPVSTTAASKLSPMGSRSGTVPNKPATPPSSAQSREQARRSLGLTPGHRRKRRQTCPELVRARRCRLVVVGVEGGGRFSTEAATWLRLLARHRASAAPQLCSPLHGPCGWLGGPTLLRSRHTAPWPPQSSPGRATSEVKRPSCTMSSLTCAGSSRSMQAG